MSTLIAQRAIHTAFALWVCTATAMESDEKRGYWWSKEEHAVEETPYPKLGPPPPEAELAAMHPKQIEKLIEDYREFALWKTDPQTVTWYYQVQDHARRRSLAFMNVTEYVMLREADLNMNSEYPTNAPGQNARIMARESEVSQRVGAASDRAALILLTQPNCGYCEAQRATLTNFKQQHGWTVREIDISQQPSAITRFGTDYTPTTVMILRDSSEWMPVAVGVESVAKITESVYRSLRLIDGEITPRQFTVQGLQDGGVNDPSGSRR